MWIISSKMFQKFFDMVSGNLSNIERQLIFNRQIKVNTTKRLISFQETIGVLNNELHLYRLNYINARNDRDRIKEKVFVISLKTRLITYISAWSLNVKQGIITSNTVKQCVGPLLNEEWQMLDRSLIKLLRQKGQNYTDALNCKWLFKAVLS